MADVTIGNVSFDMLDIATLPWISRMIADSTTIQLHSGSFDQVFRGSGFSYDQAGDLTGGTLAQFEQYLNGNLQITVSGVAASAVTIFSLSNANSTLSALEFLLSENDTITGSSLSGETLLGGSGNDIFHSGAGNSITFVEGAGDDTYILDAPGTTLLTFIFAFELGAVSEIQSGTDTLQSAAHNLDISAFSFVENAVLTGSDNFNLTGNTGSNVLTGNTGNSILNGDAGADTMTGGGGDDGYFVDHPGDSVVEASGEGTDIVMSSISYALLANIENLTLTGGANLDGTGNGLDNTLTGNSGNNVLYGAAGNDTLDGGDGNDMYIVGDNDTIVDSSGIDMVQSYIPWVLQSGLENLTLLGSAAYGVGNELNNVIIGNAASNSLLRGGAGADTIYGGAGDDWIEGETGNDPFVGVAGNDTLYGEAGDDTVLAGAGDDVVYGGSGTDFLIGETGNDLMYGGSEWDAIDGRQDSDVLYGEGGADIIFGDGYFYLFGFANDSLFGGDGDDIMMGEAGEHLTQGADDLIYGEGGNDLLFGGGGNDVIYGGDGDDVIDGGHGNDYIVGGPGAEIMQGSGDSDYGDPTVGGDLFVYQSPADAGDRIWGFDLDVSAGNDGIDLRGLFDTLGYAGTNPRGDGWLLVTTGATTNDTVVWIDPNGGADSPLQLLTLYGVAPAALTDSYFIFQ